MNSNFKRSKPTVKPLINGLNEPCMEMRKTQQVAQQAAKQRNDASVRYAEKWDKNNRPTRSHIIMRND